MSIASPSLLVSFRNLSRPLAALTLAAAMTLAAASEAAAAKAAAIVVDASTGKTLYASNADARRYPASLTKMMTLYMVFEAMVAGKIDKNTKVRFSKHAASRPPTKLGVGTGRSITVEQAILALVTKSANDAAAAIGELLGGSEANFARMMTAKARQLGMKSTTFRNASGLPDSEQVTTARDMAILGMSLREHFPKYYGYFSTRSFTFGRTRMSNHNKLLGRVKGVDGIKTGYTRASGFNLVSSVKIGDRKLVAVVMGGSSGRSRDARMAELIRAYMPKTKSRGDNPLVAERRIDTGVASATASLSHIPVPKARPDREEVEEITATAQVAYAAPAPQPKIAVPVVAEETGEGDIDPVSTSAIEGGWVVQVGSLGSDQEARAFLAKTAAKADALLADASPFTEVFVKGGATYHRARFGGFASQDAATRTCAALKKRDIACYATQR